MSWIDYTPLGFAVNQVAKLAASGATELPSSSGNAIVATASQGQDVDAITQYMANAKTEAQAYPEAAQAIADYSKWLSSVSLYRRTFDAAGVLSEAKYYRDKLNSILPGRKPDPSVTPADGVTSLQIPAAVKDPTPKTPLIPTPYKYAIAAGGSAVLVIVLLKKLKVI
jgi:hypothetical protein